MQLKHPYLYDSVCVGRLLDDYEKHGTLYVAYDFDNTVYDFHAKGHDYSEVIDLLRECKALGFFLTVFTAEQDTDKVKDYLDWNAIPYDAINENVPFFNSEAKKIYFNILLDDRAGLRSAYDQLGTVVAIIKRENNEKV